MLEKRPDSGDEYQDWEYPDPEDVEAIANLPFKDEPPSGGPRIPVMKIGGALMALAFVGSLLVPLLGLFNGGGDNRGTDTTQADLAYQQWIGGRVSEALSGYGGVGQVRYLGVQFGESLQDPVVGLLSEGVDVQSSSDIGALQGYSMAVLRGLFADERARSVTIVWLGSPTDNANGEPVQEVTLMVGMLRDTAESIDWASIGPEDLRYVADYYQELPPTGAHQTRAAASCNASAARSECTASRRPARSQTSPLAGTLSALAKRARCLESAASISGLAIVSSLCRR